MGGLHEHLFEAGGLDVFQFFELGCMFRNEFIGIAKVQPYFFLFS